MIVPGPFGTLRLIVPTMAFSSSDGLPVVTTRSTVNTRLKLYAGRAFITDLDGRRPGAVTPECFPRIQSPQSGHSGQSILRRPFALQRDSTFIVFEPLAEYQKPLDFLRKASMHVCGRPTYAWSVRGALPGFCSRACGSAASKWFDVQQHCRRAQWLQTAE